MKKHTIGIALALALSAFAIAQQSSPRSSGGIDGFGRYSDGTPSAEATVTAVTECKEMGYNSLKKVRTSSDGSFYVPPFLDANCDQVRLSAERVEDFWLRTGHDVFDGRDNGTTPLVEAPRSGFPTTAEITLGNRGALVSFRVRDAATGSFIWAGLHLERMPVPGAKFGSMDIATGRDGSPDTLLLPAGEYKISVDRYSCRGMDYSTMSPPCEGLTVEAGKKVAWDISVDARLIKPRKSYNNPRGKPCQP